MPVQPVHERHRGDVQPGGVIRRSPTLDGCEIVLFCVCVVQREEVEQNMVDAASRLQKSSRTPLYHRVEDAMRLTKGLNKSSREKISTPSASLIRDGTNVSMDVMRCVVNMECLVLWSLSRELMKALQTPRFWCCASPKVRLRRSDRIQVLRWIFELS